MQMTERIDENARWLTDAAQVQSPVNINSFMTVILLGSINLILVGKLGGGGDLFRPRTGGELLSIPHWQAFIIIVIKDRYHICTSLFKENRSLWVQ